MKVFLKDGSKLQENFVLIYFLDGFVHLETQGFRYILRPTEIERILE